MLYIYVHVVIYAIIKGREILQTDQVKSTSDPVKFAPLVFHIKAAS